MDWTLLFGIISAISATCAIIAFVYARKKETKIEAKDETKELTEMKSDTKYIRNTIDDVRLDIRELSRKQDALVLNDVRQDERLNMLEKKVEKLEEKR